MTIRSIIRTVAILTGAAAASHVALAQSASSSVAIFRVGLPTLTFPGVGTSSFNFASGSFLQGSGSSTGTASAGRGRLTAFAASGDFGGAAGSLSSMATHAAASLSDSFTVVADTGVPLRLEFGMRASGNVSAVRSGTSTGGGSPNASVEWNVGMNGGGSSFSASGMVSESYGFVVVEGILTRPLIRTETGLSFSEFALVANVGNGQVGETFSLGMSALARAGYNAGPAGSTMSGVADFGSTLRWLGLQSVTHMDGTPYLGALQITSASGFDYSTPAPGAAVLMVAAAAISAGRRRRSDAPAPV